MEKTTSYFENFVHSLGFDMVGIARALPSVIVAIVVLYVIYKLLKNIGVVPEIERNIGYDKSIINDVIRADKICNINIENIVWEFCR